MEPGRSRRPAGLLWGGCCGTTASRPSTLVGRVHRVGYSRQVRRGVRAEPAVSYGNLRHLFIVCVVFQKLFTLWLKARRSNG